MLCCIFALIGRLFYPLEFSLSLTHSREPSFTRFGLLLGGASFFSATWMYTLPVDNAAGGGTKNAMIAWNVLDPTTPVIEAMMSSPTTNWCVGGASAAAAAAAPAGQGAATCTNNALREEELREHASAHAR